MHYPNLDLNNSNKEEKLNYHLKDFYEKLAGN